MSDIARHKQIEVVGRDGLVEVDIELERVLRAFWLLGINTYYSCQGDAFFKDETLYQNKPHRGYIVMERTTKSISLVNDLMFNLQAIRRARVLWDFEFNNRPIGDRPQICIRFPNCDIPELSSYMLSQEL